MKAVRLTNHCRKVSAGITIVIFIFIFSYTCLNLQAQTNATFSSTDKFSIPSYNGTISFAVNGSYSTASLQGNVWTFTDFHLNGSLSIATLKISTENSNLTILSYRTRNGTVQIPNETLRYSIVGEGKVTINLGISNPGQYGGSDWYVSKAGRNSTIFLSLGHDYSLGKDGTLTVYDVTGNVSVTHDFLNGYLGNNTNLPFYLQHSVIIAMTLILVITVSVVVVIKLKNKRSSRQEQNGGDN